MIYAPSLLYFVSNTLIVCGELAKFWASFLEKSNTGFYIPLEVVALVLVAVFKSQRIRFVLFLGIMRSGLGISRTPGSC